MVVAGARRIAVAGIVGNCLPGGAAWNCRGESDLPRSNLSQRRHPGGPLCAGRSDDRLWCRVGRKTARNFHHPFRQLRLAIHGSATRPDFFHLFQGRVGNLFTPGELRGFCPVGNFGAGAARRGRSARGGGQCSVGRLGAGWPVSGGGSSQQRCTLSPGISCGQRNLRAQRLGRPPAFFAERKFSGHGRSRALGRRWPSGDH